MSASLPQRRIGDRTVGAIGLGAMPVSVPGAPDRAQAVETIHAALDAGVTLVDTADAYSPDGVMGHNEELVAAAVASWTGETADGLPVMIATKGGHTRDGGDWGLDGSPAYLRTACEASLRRLGVDAIDLYQHHRPDPSVPYAETVGGLRDLLDAGLVRRVGLSNADPDQIRLAHEILGDGLVSVQNQLSPSFRSSLPEVEVCEELGLAFLPWSPLGGIGGAKDLATTAEAFAEVGQRHDASPQQTALAWLLALSPCVVPIPGASRPVSIQASATAATIELGAEDVALLDAVAPVAP